MSGRRSLLGSPVFWVLALLAIGGACIYMYQTKWAADIKVGRAQSKGRVMSAYYSAAQSAKKASGKWPKSKADMAGEKRIKELSAGELDGTEYTLKSEVSDLEAVYELDYHGDKKEVRVKISTAPEKAAAAGFSN